MNYHPDDYVNLAQAVERGGGYIQPDPCEGTTYKLKVRTESGKVRTKRYRTTACGLNTRMAVKYDPTTPIDLKLPVHDKHGDFTGKYATVKHPGEPDRGMAAVPVCAVDDALGLWPRYASAVTDRSYLRDD